jgi:uncharacterized protein YPO0396
MGQALSRFTDCGLLHVLVGDPDYEIEDGQIQYSASRRSRDKTQIEQRVADALPKREERCARLSREIEQNQEEAMRCRAMIMNAKTPPAMRKQAIGRADRLLKDINRLSGARNREQLLIRQGRTLLERVNNAATGATDEEFLSDLNSLASHVNASPAAVEKLEQTGESLEEHHHAFGDYDAALGNVLSRLENANGADEIVDLQEASINEKDVMSALESMFQTQNITTTMADQGTYAGAQYEEVVLNMPSVPDASLPRGRNVQNDTAIAVTNDGRARTTQTRRNNFSDLY